MKATAENVAALLGVPVANVRAQYAINAKDLRDMERTARQLRRKYRGKTAAQWAVYAEHAEQQAYIELCEKHKTAPVFDEPQPA